MLECSSKINWDKHAVQDRLFQLCLLLEDEEQDIFESSVMYQEDTCEDHEDKFLDQVAWLEKRMVVSQVVDDIRREAEQVLSAMDFPISELPPVYDKYTPLDVMRAALGESSKPDCSLKEEQFKAVHELYWTMKHFISKLRQVSQRLPVNNAICSAEGSTKDPQVAHADTLDAPDGLVMGARVEIHSVRSRPDLNGQWGRLLEFDHPESRWHIVLDTGTSLFLETINITRAPPSPGTSYVAPNIAAAGAPCEDTNAVDDVQPELLRLGTQVQVHSLGPELNGKEGELLEDGKEGEPWWRVLVDDGSNLILKASNLEALQDDVDHSDGVVAARPSCQVPLTEFTHAPIALHQHLESATSSESLGFLRNPSSKPSTSATPGQCSYVGTKCRPCRWHHTLSGCRLALQCKFCHVCPREKRPNQKMRAARRYGAGVREREAQLEAAMAEHFGNTYHDMQGLNTDVTPF